MRKQPGPGFREVEVCQHEECCLLLSAHKKAIILCRSSKAAAAIAAAAIFYLSSQDLDASELRAAFGTWVQRLTSLNQVRIFFLSFFLTDDHLQFAAGTFVQADRILLGEGCMKTAFRAASRLQTVKYSLA